jgi:hypothetical protein
MSLCMLGVCRTIIGNLDAEDPSLSKFGANSDAIDVKDGRFGVFQAAGHEDDKAGDFFGAEKVPADSPLRELRRHIVKSAELTLDDLDSIKQHARKRDQRSGLSIPGAGFGAGHDERQATIFTQPQERFLNRILRLLFDTSLETVLTQMHRDLVCDGVRLQWVIDVLQEACGSDELRKGSFMAVYEYIGGADDHEIIMKSKQAAKEVFG